MERNLEASSSCWPSPCEYPPEGSLHIRVPETVDEWVQHRVDDSVENPNSFIIIRKFDGPETHVGKDTCAIEYGNRSEVRAACGESFLSAFSRADSQNCSCHMHIRGENECHGGSCHDETHSKEQQLIELGTGAGQLEELRQVTVEVIDHIETTEVKCGYGHSMSKYTAEGTNPRRGQQDPLDGVVHLGAVNEC